YTCSQSLLANAKLLADEYHLPYAMHLLESSSEQTRLQRKFGKKATEYLRDIGYLTDRFVAFHCVSLDDGDMQLFADHSCKAVHNPESNMKLSSGIAPVPAMQNAGVTVGLGTDGCASNNNLDMFQEMDTVAKLHKVAKSDPTVMDAKTVIRMATREGARALGLEKLTGSLEVNKKADIIIIGLNKPHLTPLYNEYSHLVYSAGGADVDTVLINGKLIMKDRRLLTVDEDEIMSNMRKFAVGINSTLRGLEERKK
ncbi:MAG: amidohydrolase family protein, partial [Syntrophales bacterium LBB04]|nr:amidohydrolase family protein [Syntrophales bacterium LBB04]